MVDPLIFIIVFAILFVILLILTTYYLDLNNRLLGCQFKPNIWCFNDWTCPSQSGGAPACEGKPVCPSDAPPTSNCVNVCYTNNGTINSLGQSATGLLDCLVGPNSQAAKVCGGVPANPNEPACGCDIATTNSCFSNCPSGVKSDQGLNPDTVCCVQGKDCPSSSS